MIKEFNEGKDHKLIDTIALSERLFFMSDNIAFARLGSVDDVSMGIPSGTFATTTFADHIHSPDDEAEFFDFKNMAGLVDHFTEMVIMLSDSEKEINWTDPGYVRLK